MPVSKCRIGVYNCAAGKGAIMKAGSSLFVFFECLVPLKAQLVGTCTYSAHWCNWASGNNFIVLPSERTHSTRRKRGSAFQTLLWLSLTCHNSAAPIFSLEPGQIFSRPACLTNFLHNWLRFSLWSWACPHTYESAHTHKSLMCSPPLKHLNPRRLVWGKALWWFPFEVQRACFSTEH